MSSHRAPSVAKQSSSLAGRIKPIFPSSRRWSSTGRENYRIYPESRPSRLDWTGWLSVLGVQVAWALLFLHHCFRLLQAELSPYGRRPQNQPISFVTDHSIRELAPRARCPPNTSLPTNTTLAHPAGRLAARMTWPTIQTRSTRPAFPIIK